VLVLRSDHLAGQLAAFGVEDVFDDPIGGDGGGVRDVVSFTGFGGQLAIMPAPSNHDEPGPPSGRRCRLQLVFRQRAAVNQF
jgi:hypothetical protein